MAGPSVTQTFKRYAPSFFDRLQARLLTFTLGGWVHFDRFADLRAPFSPSVAVPTEHSGNLAGYGMVDAAIWKSDTIDGRSLRAFGRISVSPSNRNPVDAYLDAGLVLKAPFRGRANDAVGLAIALAHISRALRDAERQANMLGLPSASVPRAEAVIEATCSLAVSTQLSPQPNAQFVRHPAGNLFSPAVPSRRIGNAMVIGLRTTLTL